MTVIACVGVVSDDFEISSPRRVETDWTWDASSVIERVLFSYLRAGGPVSRCTSLPLL